MLGENAEEPRQLLIQLSLKVTAIIVHKSLHVIFWCQHNYDYAAAVIMQYIHHKTNNIISVQHTMMISHK